MILETMFLLQVFFCLTVTLAQPGVLKSVAVGWSLALVLFLIVLKMNCFHSVSFLFSSELISLSEDVNKSNLEPVWSSSWCVKTSFDTSCLDRLVIFDVLKQSKDF